MTELLIFLCVVVAMAVACFVGYRVGFLSGDKHGTMGQSDITHGMRAKVREIADLKARVVELRTERDLAIAHDRQPYPTAEAYERACAALEEKRKIITEGMAGLKKQAEKLEADVAELKKSQKAPTPKKAPAGDRALGDRLNKTEAVVTAGQKLEAEMLRCFTTIPADLSGPWMNFRAKLREVEK